MTNTTILIAEMNTQQLNSKSASLSNGISRLQQEISELESIQKEVSLRKGVLAREKWEDVHLASTLEQHTCNYEFSSYFICHNDRENIYKCSICGKVKEGS